MSASTLHRHFRRLVKSNMTFETVAGTMTCQKCGAVSVFPEGLKCRFSNDMPNSLTHTSGHSHAPVEAIPHPPCIFDGLTYSEAKDILSERS